jgi:hypothetical protein
MTKIDKAAWQRRLDRLSELLSGIADHAEEVSRHRCPYRDRLDQCTAAFRCRAQRPPETPGGPARCGHDGTFDYRSAWESSASAYDVAKARIERVRTEAARRRRQSPAGSEPE